LEWVCRSPKSNTSAPTGLDGIMEAVRLQHSGTLGSASGFGGKPKPQNRITYKRTAREKVQKTTRLLERLYYEKSLKAKKKSLRRWEDDMGVGKSGGLKGEMGATELLPQDREQDMGNYPLGCHYLQKLATIQNGIIFYGELLGRGPDK